MTKHTIGEQLANSLPLSTIGEPYTIDEIDKHPDAQRIWRTIQEVCCYHEDEVSDFIYTENDLKTEKQESYDKGYCYGLSQSSEDYDNGWDAGFECGHDTGYDKGYKEGLEDGRNT